MDDLPVLRLLHVVGAVLLLGNVTITGFWATYLYRVRRRVPFHPVARAILWSDVVFTVVGGTMLTVSGILLALRRGYRVEETTWLLKGIVALGVATLLWIVVLVPVQLRLERVAADDDRELRRLFFRWSAVGWASTLLLFYGLWAMVTKG